MVNNNLYLIPLSAYYVLLAANNNQFWSLMLLSSYCLLRFVNKQCRQCNQPYNMLPVNIQNDDIANTIHNGNLQTDITFQ
jgi:hypothetical protein